MIYLRKNGFRYRVKSLLKHVYLFHVCAFHADCVSIISEMENETEYSWWILLLGELLKTFSILLNTRLCCPYQISVKLNSFVINVVSSFQIVHAHIYRDFHSCTLGHHGVCFNMSKVYFLFSMHVMCKKIACQVQNRKNICIINKLYTNLHICILLYLTQN